MNCKDCVDKAKLRNRDRVGMELKARQKATNEQKPQAICWEIKTGLFIEDAALAIRSGYSIHDIVSVL